MKMTRKYRRPWHGDDAGKLVAEIETPQSGDIEIAICPTELVRISQMVNNAIKHKPGSRGNSSTYRTLRREVLRAVADYIAAYLPNELEGPKP